MARRLPRGELSLLSQIRQRSKTNLSRSLRLGIGDDCAILRPAKQEEVIVTTDLSLENAHFRLEWHQPESIGHRCLARGLSDIAAMGGRPLGAFLSLAVPPKLTEAAGQRKSWLERFYDGLLSLAASAGVPLAGGDLAQNPTVVADIVLVGAVPQNRALLRSGAKVGDWIYVTGALGGSAAELQMLSRNPRHFSRLRKLEEHPHLFPQPRLGVGHWLLRRATAAIDVSDGISTDLAHLCEESGTAAEIDVDALPIHALATKGEKDGLVKSAVDCALNGGEDYELLFTASASTRIPAMIAGIPIHKIGRITKRHGNKPVMSLLKGGSAISLDARGWQHFKG